MHFQNYKEKVLIIDFGSQVTKLIARRIRELGVYSEIITPKDLIKLKEFHNIKGLILSGGPSTVTTTTFQSVPKDIFKKKIPILGICYGLQLIAKIFGGKIKPSKKKREFGRTILYRKNTSLLTKNFLNNKRSVWMSHEDAVVKLPKKFKNHSYVVIDGKFVCLDPYLGTNYHLLSDVKYSKIEIIKKEIPNFRSSKKRFLDNKIRRNIKKSNFKHFISHSSNYLPFLKEAKYIGSMYVIRALKRNVEKTDERTGGINLIDNKIISVFSGEDLLKVKNLLINHVS